MAEAPVWPLSPAGRNCHPGVDVFFQPEQFKEGDGQHNGGTAEPGNTLRWVEKWREQTEEGGKEREQKMGMGTQKKKI